MHGVTLRQIADVVGCTRASVSYALQNSPKVSPKLREEIRSVADRLGWVPNADLARHMALTRAIHGNGRQLNLAAVVAKPKSQLDQEYVPRMQWQGIVERAKQLGYSLSTFNLADSPVSAKRLRSIFRSRGIVGIVYLATLENAFPSAVFDLGREWAASVVAMHCLGIGFHVATTDFLVNGRIAMAAMVRLGVTRIGVALPRGVDEPLGWSFSAGLIAGAFASYPGKPPAVFYGSTDQVRFVEEDRTQLWRWLKKYRPEAVLTSDTPNLARLLTNFPGRAPKIYSLDYFPGLEGALGGVDQRGQMAGKAGVDLVMVQVHGGEFGVPSVQKSVNIAGAWVMAPK